MAAAASEPSSFTSMNALWMTAEMNNSRLPVIPEKSASPENTRGFRINANQRQLGQTHHGLMTSLFASALTYSSAGA